MQHHHTKHAKHIVCGEISTISRVTVTPSLSYAIVVNNRIQGDLLRLEKICSFSLDDSFESTLVNAEVIMV
jgi:hypothetical protein